MDPIMIKVHEAWGREIKHRESRTAQELTFPCYPRYEPYKGNLIIVVAAEDAGVGRNGLVNILASCLVARELPIAIFEYGLRTGKASKAHAAEGVKSVLINPLETDHVAKMLDMIEKLTNHVIILTVGRSVWNIFSAFEHLLIECFAPSHGFIYLFVTLTPDDEVRLLDQHQRWMRDKGYPRYPHTSCVRAAQYPSAPKESARVQQCDTLIIPYLSEKARGMMFTGKVEQSGEPPKFMTFAKVWHELSRGYLMVMKADFNTLFVKASYWTDCKDHQPKLPDESLKEKKIG